jgi:DNA-binding transcriptional MocR family regulator
VLRQFALARQTADLHSNTLGQWVLDRFMQGGRMSEHMRSVRQAYRRRRDAMDTALREAGVPGLGWQRPQGGFYFWCRLPAGVRPTALLARAAEAGVSYLPGRACFADEPPAEFIRLNFSYPDEGQIREGVARLAAVIRQESDRPRTTEIQAASTRPIV